VKILEFHLTAYGHFRDTRLDLSEGTCGLHLIYGPNEAGKSTTLRALRSFLFGFAHICDDAFLHANSELRLGAVLEAHDGSRLQCVRRKGKKNTLRDADDNRPVDEAKLTEMLSGLDEDGFVTRFGIDHRRLVEGGQAIASGQGDLGEILFAAGSGIADMGAIDKQLLDAAGALFKGGAAKQPSINAALSQLREARRRRNEAALPTAEWEQHHNALNDALQRRGELQQRLARLRSERQRVTRILDALPDISQRNELLRQLESLADVPPLPADFPKRREDASTELTVARRACEEIKRQLDEVEQQAKQLASPEPVLEVKEEIGRLHSELGQHLKAGRDRPLLVQRRNRLLSEILDATSRDFGESAEPAAASVEDDPRSDRQVRPLILRTADRERISNLGNSKAKVEAAVEECRKNCQLLEVDIERLNKRLHELPATGDPRSLRAATRSAQQLGQPEEKQIEAARQLDEARQSLDAALRALPLWGQDTQQLAELAVPAGETIDRFEGWHDQAKGDLQQARRRRESLAEDLRAKRQKIEQLSVVRDVPSEEDLKRLRAVRDEGWRLVQQALDGGAPDADATPEFIAAHPPAESLKQAFSLSIQQADLLADRLRREAEAVGRKAALSAEVQAGQSELREAQRLEEQSAAELERFGQQWRQLWQAIAIEPLPPREMRAWLRQREDVLRQARQAAELQRQLDTLHDRIDEHRDRLKRERNALAEFESASPESLAAAIELAEALAARIEGRTRQREQLQQQLDTKHAELPAAELALARAEQERQQWARQWAEVMQRVGVPSDATPEVANALVAAITDIQTKQGESADLAERIAGIDRDAALFDADVRRLAGQVASDLGDKAVDELVQALFARLEEATRVAGRRDDLAQQARRLEEKRRGAHERRTAAEARLKTLCQEAGCTSTDELNEAERLGLQRAGLQQSLAECDQRLTRLAAGAPLEDFLAEAGDADADHLEPRLAQLDEQLAQCETEKSQSDTTIGSEQAQLAAMDGSDAAAAAGEHVQSLLAQIDLDARQYVRLQLASAVLRQAMERYREKNQDPVLRRSSHLFQRFTLGQYAHLETDYDGDRARLVAVRADDGRRISVAGMSDGTCDQLFLALRLASVEHYLDHHRPVPLVVDDILNRFDDQRSAAALAALAELSDKTQVIFFTHHRHLIDVARRQVDDGRLFVHQLHGRAEVPAEELFAAGL